MTIGAKFQRITLQARVETADAQGGKVVTHATRATLWANERPLNGREALQAQQVTAVLSSVWEIWFRTDVSAKDRIVLGTRVVEIESYYDPDGRGRELYLLCAEVQA